MRVVLQKVQKAHVSINNTTVGSIAEGFCILLGIKEGDTQKDTDWLVEKVCKLRLFADPGSQTFMDKNILDVGGSMLVVSQFTLYGDCKKGTKPSFSGAARPEQAEPLYEYFVEKVREKGIEVQTGRFGEHMQVHIVNDGPITLLIDSPEAQG